MPSVVLVYIQGEENKEFHLHHPAPHRLGDLPKEQSSDGLEELLQQALIGANERDGIEAIQWTVAQQLLKRNDSRHSRFRERA